jgi:hypothetical protein
VWIRVPCILLAVWYQLGIHYGQPKEPRCMVRTSITDFAGQTGDENSRTEFTDTPLKCGVAGHEVSNHEENAQPHTTHILTKLWTASFLVAFIDALANRE